MEKHVPELSKSESKRLYNAVVKAFLACDSEAFVDAYLKAINAGLAIADDSPLTVCYRGLRDKI